MWLWIKHALIDRWSACCSLTGRRTPRLETTAGGEPSSTCPRLWPPTCRRRGWSHHLGQSRTTKIQTAAAVEGAAGGFPESSRETWTRWGSWTHRLRQRGSRPPPGGPKVGCRGSRPSPGWTPGCIEAATEPRSSTAPPSGMQEKWEEGRSFRRARCEPDRCPTCSDEATLNRRHTGDTNQLFWHKHTVYRHIC